MEAIILRDPNGRALGEQTARFRVGEGGGCSARREKHMESSLQNLHFSWHSPSLELVKLNPKPYPD